MQEQTRRPQVVIAGAGFGGLEAAKALSRADADITLIDKRNYHLFQPLLYQVATADLSPAEVAWPIRSIFSHARNVRVVLASIDGIDKKNRVALAGPLRFPYDYLVLATGSHHSYFGHDEWAMAAPGLKRIIDAVEICKRILLAFERAEIAADDAERQKQLTFVIVGGGPTGVEMAGAIAELARHALAADFRNINPKLARVLLIEAGERVLNTFPEKLSDYAKSALEKLGVEVLLNSPVRITGGQEAAIGERTIKSATMIWAAGVAVPNLKDWLGVETDRIGRVKVEPDLSVPGYPEIFVIGDAALTPWKTGTPAPGIAPAAKQAGKYAARIIKAAAAGNREKTGPFRYRHHGNLATIGRNSAIADFGRIRLTGSIAWWLWGLAHIYFLIGVRSATLVAIQWLWAYLTFGKGARLITGPLFEPVTPEKKAQEAKTLP